MNLAVMKSESNSDVNPNSQFTPQLLKDEQLRPELLISNKLKQNQSLAQEVNQKPQQSITENRLKTLLKALPAGVVVLDGAGKVVECNPAAISLLGEPLLGEAWMDVINRAFNPFLASGQDVISSKGRIVNISTCPLGDNLPGQIILLQDVTDNRTLQAKVEQHERLAAMGQMAAQLAHQIRTPIASALLYASHLQRSNLTEEQRIRFAKKILNRIQNLERLIKDMLLFSKNGMENSASIEAKHLFDELQYSTNVDERITINFDTQLEHSTHVFGNQNLLLSSLINLLENAAQAIDVDNDTNPKEVKVTLCQVQEGHIDFRISDTGSGIAKDDLKRIFEPFYTTKSEGTGLGLAVVKAIAHGHKGELWVEKTDSQGTIFVLRLPEQIHQVDTNDHCYQSATQVIA